MNPNLIVAIIAIVLGLAGQWGIIAYYAGRQTKTVEGLGDRIDLVEQAGNKRLDGHSTWIKEIVKSTNDTARDHGERLVRVEERLKIGG